MLSWKPSFFFFVSGVITILLKMRKKKDKYITSETICFVVISCTSVRLYTNYQADHISSIFLSTDDLVNRGPCQQMTFVYAI